MTELDIELVPEIRALIAELGIKRTVTRPGPKGLGKQVGPDTTFEAVITPPQLEEVRSDDKLMNEIVAYTADVVMVGDEFVDNTKRYSVRSVAEYRTGELVAARQLVMKR